MAFSVSTGRVGSGSSLLSPDDHEGNAPDVYYIPHALNDHVGHVHDCNEPHDCQAYDGISHIHWGIKSAFITTSEYKIHFM